MSGLVTGKKFEIHYSQVDLYKRIKITSIIDFFTDIATYQSEKVDIGIDYLRKNGMGWVVIKWDIDILKYPNYMDEVEVITQPIATKKFYAYRIFKIKDKEGNTVVNVKSLWALMDINKKRPMRIPEEICKGYDIREDKNQFLDFQDLFNFEESENSLSFRIRYGDIDTNGHVNNEKYVAWMIETVPKEIVTSHVLAKIKINYKKESKYGEEIQTYIKIKNEEDTIRCMHKITNNDGQVLTIGESIWKKL